MTQFQTQLREIPALWFAWILIFVYWLLYLFADATTKSVFDSANYTENIFTAWPFYSVFRLAHEEFFTKLSRLTVMLLQWTLQGVFIAAMIATQYSTGVSVIFWSAILTYLVTAIVPFAWGNIFFKKIYRKHLMKFHTQKKILESTDKEKNKEYEENINLFE